MKLTHRAQTPDAHERQLFEPWERLLIVSHELDGLEGGEAMRAIASASFACIRHMAGRLARVDAYRSVARALASVREAKLPTAPGATSAPPSAELVQHRLPIDDGETVRVSREVVELVTRYARERDLAFEDAVERLLRTADRRRAAVNRWARKPRRQSILPNESHDVHASEPSCAVDNCATVPATYKGGGKVTT